MSRNLFLSLLCCLLLLSCGKDNYDPPESELSGKIISRTTGDAIGVRETGTPVEMQLYQDGYQLHTPILVYVNQDGTFSAKLFDGVYKLVSADNAGPWVNKRDTVLVSVKGNSTVDYPVDPYFTLENENFKVSGDVLTVNFNILQEIKDPTKQMQSVTLYINNTRFVDSGYNKMAVTVPDPSLGSNSLSVNISKLSSYPVLYARIGLQITNIGQQVYTVGSVKIK